MAEGIDRIEWRTHFNSSYFDGEWTGVALRAPPEKSSTLYADPAESTYVDTAAFWEGARNGKLMLQYCKDTGKYQHYPKPVSIFTGTMSEEDSLDIARHAKKIGADMILAISPYCRRPTQDEIFDSMVRIGTATDLPLLTYNSPWRNGEGVEFTGELTRRLIERLPNYIGMKDASFHSEKFLEISRVALSMRPGFAIIMGVEHLLASYPLGACGSFSSSGAIAPKLCNKFFASLVAHDWPTARECQYKISRLWRLFKEQYPSSLKGAMIMMGRPVGPTRSPLPTATKERIDFLRQQLEELNILQTEPIGW